MPFKQDRRLFFSISALLLYALWGSPTPDRPGILEVVIAVLLILSVGIVPLMRCIFRGVGDQVEEKWQFAGRIFFIYGLIVPLIGSAVHGFSGNLILRDVVGFMFLCLPVFLFSFFDKNALRQKAFFIALLGVGFIFSLRVLFPDFRLFQVIGSAGELLYLANSPLVLMSAIFLLSYAAKILYGGVRIRSIGLACLFLVMGSVILSAMMIDLQRASFAALGVSVLALVTIGVMKAPVKMMMPVLILGVAGAFLLPMIAEVVDDIALKTARVGLNMRQQELQAVWESFDGSWPLILWGQGWGSSFASPAVGGLHVTFTHSLLTYVFFKMGLSGLILCLVYLFFMFEKICRVYFIDPVKGNALMWPLLIPIFLYASHKSFDFGLLLTFIVVSANRLSARGEGAV